MVVAFNQRQGPVAAEMQRCVACLRTSAATCLFDLIRKVPLRGVSRLTIECASCSVNEMAMQSFAGNTPFVPP